MNPPPHIPPPPHSVIAKVFRQADTEESGTVSTTAVPSLAVKVLGANIKESDTQLVQYWVEQKDGECVCVNSLLTQGNSSI